MNGAHLYEGKSNSRHRRKLAKLTVGQPPVINLERLEELMLSPSSSRPSSSRESPFNPPRIRRT
jgi:hypothetical protein